MENATTLRPPSTDFKRNYVVVFMPEHTIPEGPEYEIINTQSRQYKSVFFQETSRSMSIDMSQVNLN